MKGETYFDISKYNGPKKWDELDGNQLAIAMDCLSSNISILDKVRLLTMCLLLNAHKGSVLVDTPDAIRLTKFLFEGMDRTEPPFASYRIGIKKLIPPKAKLANISFGEFIVADSNFMKFATTGDELALNKLCAILYRPKRLFRFEPYNGDDRKKFNSNNVERDASRWQKVPLRDRLAIMAFFAGSKQAIASTFKILFKKGEEGKGGSWLGAMHVFTDNITQYDTVLKTKANLVFFDMSKQLEDAKRIEEEMEALKRR